MGQTWNNFQVLIILQCCHKLSIRGSQVIPWEQGVPQQTYSRLKTPQKECKETNLHGKAAAKQVKPTSVLANGHDKTGSLMPWAILQRVT